LKARQDSTIMTRTMDDEIERIERRAALIGRLSVICVRLHLSGGPRFCRLLRGRL
jgi:hypothetical protein